MRTKLVLGIETSGNATGLALASDNRVVAELVENTNCSHNEVLMPLLDRLLKGAGVAVADVAGIGVDVGPGMFTSLRVGISTAKGLAIAHQLPIVSVNSLWSLARTASPGLDRVLAVMDARKHQVYAALYIEGRAAIAPALFSPEQLSLRVGPTPAAHERVVVAGDGAALCREQLAAVGIRLEPSGIEHPSPGVVAVEAAARIAGGMVDDVAALEPLYLRRTDAELAREQKLKPAG